MSGREAVPPADFAAFDKACVGSEAQRTRVLTVVGGLVVSWANNESLLAYLIRYLMDTEQDTAAVVFSCLGNARARVDLVERLTTLNVADPDLATDIRKVLRRFRECTTVRNEFNHCVYGIGDTGEIIDTQGTRLVERDGLLSLGERRPFDEARIDEIAVTARKLKGINRDLWSLVTRLRDMRGDRDTNGEPHIGSERER